MKEYYVQHTMFRVRDPRVSLPFYMDALGMTLLYVTPLDKSTMYFLGYEDADDIPIDAKERALWGLSREGTVELKQ